MSKILYYNTYSLQQGSLNYTSINVNVAKAHYFGEKRSFYNFFYYIDYGIFLFAVYSGRRFIYNIFYFWDYIFKMRVF